MLVCSAAERQRGLVGHTCSQVACAPQGLKAPPLSTLPSWGWQCYRPSHRQSARVHTQQDRQLACDWSTSCHCAPCKKRRLLSSRDSLACSVSRAHLQQMVTVSPAPNQASHLKACQVRPSCSARADSLSWQHCSCPDCDRRAARLAASAPALPAVPLQALQPGQHASQSARPACVCRSIASSACLCRHPLTSLAGHSRIDLVWLWWWAACELPAVTLSCWASIR